MGRASGECEIICSLTTTRAYANSLYEHPDGKRFVLTKWNALLNNVQTNQRFVSSFLTTLQSGFSVDLWPPYCMRMPYIP